jgi:hypothetical protein
LIVIAAVTVTSLFALGVGMRLVESGLRRVSAADSAAIPPGPRITFHAVVPAEVVGRRPATLPSLVDARASSAAQMESGLRRVPGVTSTDYLLYGPGPVGAPSRGSGVIGLAWAATQSAIPEQFVTGFADALKARPGTVLGPVIEPNGARLMCSTDTKMTMCTWIRSGTGLVEVFEYGVPGEVVQADTRAIVAELTAP